MISVQTAEAGSNSMTWCSFGTCSAARCCAATPGTLLPSFAVADDPAGQAKAAKTNRDVRIFLSMGSASQTIESAQRPHARGPYRGSYRPLGRRSLGLRRLERQNDA